MHAEALLKEGNQSKQLDALGRLLDKSTCYIQSELIDYEYTKPHPNNHASNEQGVVGGTFGEWCFWTIHLLLCHLFIDSTTTRVRGKAPQKREHDQSINQ